MRIWFALAAAGIGCVCITPVRAADDLFKGNIDVGLVNTTGNTRTGKLNAAAKLSYQQAEWRHIGQTSVLRSTDQSVTTAQRYEVDAKSEYNFTKHNFAYGNIHYENDRFSGFYHRISEVIGYGRRIIIGPRLTLDLEPGIGARQSKEKETGQTIYEPLLRLYGNAAWNVSDNTSLGEELAIDAGRDTTITRSTLALISTIVGNLATKISYDVRHVNKVPEGVKKLDTTTAVNLVYSF